MLERKKLQDDQSQRRFVSATQSAEYVAQEPGEDAHPEPPVRTLGVAWIVIGAVAVFLCVLVVGFFLRASAPQPLASYQARAATEAELAELLASMTDGQQDDAAWEDQFGDASGSLYAGPDGRLMLVNIPQFATWCLFSEGEQSFRYIVCGQLGSPLVTAASTDVLSLDSALVTRLTAEAHERVFLMAFDDRLEVWPVDPSPSPSPTSG